MSSYNKQIKRLEEKKKNAYNRYWENVSKKMKRLYFWECVVKKKKKFKMVFTHKFFEHDKKTGKFHNPKFVTDDEILIEFYANKNGLRIVDEHLFANKAVYYFEKSK